jgi:hypothetical protein
LHPPHAIFPPFFFPLTPSAQNAPQCLEDEALAATEAAVRAELAAKSAARRARRAARATTVAAAADATTQAADDDDIDIVSTTPSARQLRLEARVAREMRRFRDVADVEARDAAATAAELQDALQKVRRAAAAAERHRQKAWVRALTPPRVVPFGFLRAAWGGPGGAVRAAGPRGGRVRAHGRVARRGARARRRRRQ